MVSYSEGCTERSWLKLQSLATGATASVIVGTLVLSIVVSIISLSAGRTDPIDSLGVGLIWLTFAGTISGIVVYGAVLLLALPVYLLSPKPLSIPVATALGGLCGLLLVFLVACFGMESTMLVLVPAGILYGALAGFFSSLFEHYMLRQQAGKSFCE